MRGRGSAECGTRNAEFHIGKTHVWMGLAAILSVLLAASAARAELVDRIVAAVDNDVITWSELRQAVEFNAALGGREDSRKIEAETLEGLINRRLLLHEAYRLKLAEVSDQDIAVEVLKLRARIGGNGDLGGFLSRLNMTEAELNRVLGERLLVERFVEKKVGLFSRVSREESEAYFKDHADQFPGKSFSGVQRQILSVLTEQKTAQQLDQYIAELRVKAEMRMNPLREDRP